MNIQNCISAISGVETYNVSMLDFMWKELMAYKEAFEYVEQFAKEQKSLTEYEIKAIHSLVLSDRKEDRGQWRRVPVRIAGAATTPVQPYQIEPMIGALLADMGTIYRKLHVVEQVALFHLRFESILMNLQLIQAGYPPINVKFADRRRYYEAFDSYAKNGTPEAMVTLVAEYLQERLQSMLETIG